MHTRVNQYISVQTYVFAKVKPMIGSAIGQISIHLLD